MIAKAVLDAGRRLKGWKAVRVEFRENEMSVRFERRGGDPMRLLLIGIIASEDRGIVGRPLAGFTVTDRGSFKAIDFIPPRGGAIFHAECMEIELG
jgi:hypothetical protein